MTEIATTYKPTLGDIQRAASAYAVERARLGGCLTNLDAEIAALKRKAMPAITRAVERAAEAEAELRALVTDSPQLFERPRTVVIYGIKVGYAKGKGAIEIADAARTVALIRRHLPEQADALIRVVETPHKPALAQLAVADLKRIGCTVIDAGDEVVVKPMDGELQKLIDRMLAEANQVEAA